MEFIGIVEIFSENSLGYHAHIKIPENVYESILEEAPDKRVVCTLDSNFTFYCALQPKVTFHYILLNKEIVKKLDLSKGQQIRVQLKKDSSKYGMPISVEMQEVLFSDPDGEILFEQLTPGKKRSLIYIVNKVKNTQKRIEKSFAILEHLKREKGNLDYKRLHEVIKEFNNKYKI